MRPSDTVIIWDWDNTLVDTRPVFEKAFELLKQKHPCDYFTSENFEKLLKNWGSFWQECSLSQKEEAMHFYGDTYKEISLDYIRLMPAAQEVLSQLQEAGFQQIVVSNKVHWAIDKEVQHLNLSSYFLKYVGVEKGLHPDKKPNASYGKKALEGILYKNRVVIGDSADDILFAENLKAPCIYVQKNRCPQLSARSYFACSSLNEVNEYLQKIIS